MKSANNIENQYLFSEFRAKELALLSLYNNGKLSKDQLLLANNYLKESEMKQKLSNYLENKLENMINKIIKGYEKRYTKQSGRA